MTEFIPPDLTAIRSAAKILYSRYKDYVEYEDVQQELYLWLWAHHDRAEGWRAKYDEKHAQRTLIKALRNAGERYCRAEKAEKEGYSPDDEFFYSIPMVADLLALSFDPEWSSPASVDLESTGSGKPPGEGGNLIALVADVSRAFQLMPDPDRKILRYVYSGKNGTDMQAVSLLALQWECSQSAAYNRVRRVVGRLRAALGGPNPYQKDEE